MDKKHSSNFEVTADKNVRSAANVDAFIFYESNCVQVHMPTLNPLSMLDVILLSHYF